MLDLHQYYIENSRFIAINCVYSARYKADKQQ